MSWSSRDSGIDGGTGGEGHQQPSLTPLTTVRSGQNSLWNYSDGSQLSTTGSDFWSSQNDAPFWQGMPEYSYFYPMSHISPPTALELRSIWGYRTTLETVGQTYTMPPPTSLSLIPSFSAVTVSHEPPSTLPPEGSIQPEEEPEVAYPHGGTLEEGSGGSSDGDSSPVSSFSDDTRGEKFVEMVEEVDPGNMNRDNSAESQESDEERDGGDGKLGVMSIGNRVIVPRGLEALKEEEGVEEAPVTLLAIKCEPEEGTMADIKAELDEGKTLAEVKTEVMTMASVKTEPVEVDNAEVGQVESVTVSTVEPEVGPSSAVPQPTIPSTSAAANTELVPCNGNENRVQLPESPSASLANPDEVIRERVRQKMKDTKFFETEFGRSLQQAIMWKRCQPSKLPLVRDARIMLIGPAKFTSLISRHFERIEMSDNAVPMDATKMKKMLEQHKTDGQASKWQYFIYMMDCDAKFDQETLDRDLNLLANSVDKEERTRIELIYCRSSVNTRMEYPSMNILSSFVTQYDILATTLYHNLEDSVRRTNKYIYSRFVSCATNNFKY